MGLTREILLRASKSEWLADQLSARKFTHKAVQRFLPGEDLESALDAAAALRERGLPSIFTLLGEHVKLQDEAEDVTQHFIGTLDRTTRLGRVLVSVKDPLVREPDPERPDRPPLIVGSLVEVRIEAEPLADVIRIKRDHLRQNDTVWVKQDGKLQIRAVDIAFEDPEHVYLRGGLEDGELIVKTNLATVAADAPLRTGGETGNPGVEGNQP